MTARQHSPAGPQALKGYLETMEGEGAPLLGHLVLYSIFEGKVTPADVERWFTELGLDPSFVPADIRPEVTGRPRRDRPAARTGAGRGPGNDRGDPGRVRHRPPVPDRRPAAGRDPQLRRVAVRHPGAAHRRGLLHRPPARRDAREAPRAGQALRRRQQPDPDPAARP